MTAGKVASSISSRARGFLFFKNCVKEVWLSYYEVDKNGALCDIGASILGVLAKQHKLPVNLFPAAGKPRIVGKEKELFFFNGERVAPPKIKGYVPLTERLAEKYITKIYSHSEPRLGGAQNLDKKNEILRSFGAQDDKWNT